MSCSLASRHWSLVFPMGAEEGSFAFCRCVVPFPGECQGHPRASANSNLIHSCHLPVPRRILCGGRATHKVSCRAHPEPDHQASCHRWGRINLGLLSVNLGPHGASLWEDSEDCGFPSEIWWATRKCLGLDPLFPLGGLISSPQCPVCAVCGRMWDPDRLGWPLRAYHASITSTRFCQMREIIEHLPPSAIKLKHGCCGHSSRACRHLTCLQTEAELIMGIAKPSKQNLLSCLLQPFTGF